MARNPSIVYLEYRVAEQRTKFERLQKAATDFLLEQTDENAAALAAVLGWRRANQ